MATELKPIINEPAFKAKRSGALRIWHWGTFIVIIGSLTTVLFAKALFNSKDNAPLVQQNLQKNNISVTADQAKSVAHEFNDLVWHWHIYIGYVLAALLLFRIIFEFFQPNSQKVIPVIRNSLKYLRLPNANKENVRHYLVVRSLYLFFYLALIVQACTGLFMVYSDNVPDLKNLRHTAKDIHNIFMWILISYIVIHICGVVFAELSKKHKGIISDMINGGE